MSTTHIGDPRRRDCLLLLCATAMTLLTPLGAAGEGLGMDRMLKANTVTKRAHSLFRKGVTAVRRLLGCRCQRSPETA